MNISGVNLRKKMKAALWLVYSEKGMYVGLKQPRGDGERCVTPARAAAKETNIPTARVDIILFTPDRNDWRKITLLMSTCCDFFHGLSPSCVGAFERTCMKLQSTRSVKNRNPVLGPWYRALQHLNTFSTPEPFSFAHDRGRHGANNRRFWRREQIWTLFCQAVVRQFVCTRFSFRSKEYGG